MKIIRNIIVIILACSLLSGMNAETTQEAVMAESTVHCCDHSECEERIANLENELVQAQACCSVILWVEVSILDDWAIIDFSSGAIRMNQAACESLEIGMDISQNVREELSWLSRIVDCRIIVADIVAEA